METIKEIDGIQLKMEKGFNTFGNTGDRFYSVYYPRPMKVVLYFRQDKRLAMKHFWVAVNHLYNRKYNME